LLVTGGVNNNDTGTVEATCQVTDMRGATDYADARVVVRALCIAVLLACPAAADAAPGSPVRLPAAGELVSSNLAVRAAPGPGARLLRVLHRFRQDGQFGVVLAVRAQRAADGAWWYELSLPGRPNGQRGWVRSDLVDLRAAANRIVVHVGERRIEVRRIADDRVLLSAVVAVGKPGTETPLGRDYYVQARYIPDDPFYGSFVLVTSASSKLPDWPDGGFAGIHGTDQPDLLGEAVSHGCVRVSNAVARTLERLAPLGSPVDLLP
jgi:lipoprotein-anchoring transpeptidase ErfK/SrfK